MDTSQLKDVLKLGLDLRADLASALEDGKINFSDIPKFGNMVSDAVNAVMGADEIPAEIADLDPNELSELHQWTKDNYGIADEHVKAVVADCLEVGLKIASVVMKLLPKAA